MDRCHYFGRYPAITSIFEKKYSNCVQHVFTMKVIATLNKSDYQLSNYNQNCYTLVY